MMNSTNRKIRIMEVCGTHTATIVRGGIRTVLPKTVELVSGPGCPVCVTDECYIDKLCALAKDGAVIVTFGDMLKVPGSKNSLAELRAEGADVRMVYSPFDIIAMSRKEKEKNFVFAAVGFETIAPIYAMLTLRLRDEGIENVRLLCAIKTIPQALDMLACDVDAFIAPGHVATIIGAKAFEEMAKKLSRPFCIAGFTPKGVKAAVENLIEQVEKGEQSAVNLYPSAVSYEGNLKAQELMKRVFEAGEASWRGIGKIKGSGLYLKEEYSLYDAGSYDINEVEEKGPCRCGDVLCGKITPAECPLFGNACTPMTAKGPCMVSSEGACGIWYQCGESN